MINVVFHSMHVAYQYGLSVLIVTGVDKNPGGWHIV